MQEKRDVKRVPSGLALHEYANVYFHARNPMMSKRRNEAPRLCVLRVSTEILKVSGAVITDQNAVSKYVRFLAPDHLQYLSLEYILARNWKHPDDQIEEWRHSSAKCAEVLIPHRIPPESTDRILVKGRRHKKLRPEWAALVEVIYELEKQPYANAVGRTTLQKICYVLTKLGVDTGFRFQRSSYGPFAPEVKEAINVLANNNWIVEQQLGKMTALRVGPEYRKAREKIEEDLRPFRQKIDKTVDLFSRVKNTDQAEEVATVIYAVQNLKQERNPDEVSEADLFQYILDWKKVWRKSTEKQKSLAEAIRNLEMLGWVKLRFSESLPVSA